MKAITRFWMALAMVAILGSTMTALGQVLPRPGTRLICNFQGPIVINQDGRDYVGTVSGYGGFLVSQSNTTSATYSPVDISATSIFPELGTFTTRLDAAAAVEPSVATTLGGAATFPIYIPMRYVPIVTGPDGVDYYGGVTNFVIDASQSFNPIVGETSHLEGSVTFTSRDGSRSFTLRSLEATFNN